MSLRLDTVADSQFVMQIKHLHVERIDQMSLQWILSWTLCIANCVHQHPWYLKRRDQTLCDSVAKDTSVFEPDQPQFAQKCVWVFGKVPCVDRRGGARLVVAIYRERALHKRLRRRNGTPCQLYNINLLRQGQEAWSSGLPDPCSEAGLFLGRLEPHESAYRWGLCGTGLD